MGYLLLLPLIATVKILTQGKLIKDKIGSLRDVFLINGLIFLASSLICAVIYRPAMPDITVILYGGLLAICNMMLQVGYGVAFRAGSVSLSTTINSFSIMFPVLMGIIFFDEMLSVYKIAGLACLSVAFVLISYKKGGGTGKKWFVFTMLAFFGSGFSNCVLSILSRRNTSGGKEGYLVCAYLIAGLACLAVSLCLRRKDTPKIKISLPLLAGILIVGLMLGLYNVFLVKALGSMSNVVVYPVAGVLSTAFIALGDRVFFRHRFTGKQIAGLACAAAAVALLNL